MTEGGGAEGGQCHECGRDGGFLKEIPLDSTLAHSQAQTRMRGDGEEQGLGA